MLTADEIEVVVTKFPSWRASKKFVVNLHGYTLAVRPGDLITDVNTVRQLLAMGEDGLILPVSPNLITHQCSACGNVDIIFKEVKSENVDPASKPGTPRTRVVPASA